MRACVSKLLNTVLDKVAAEGNLGVDHHHLSAQEVKGLRGFDRSLDYVRPCVNSNDSCHAMCGEGGEVGFKFCNTEVDGFSDPLRRYIYLAESEGGLDFNLL